MRRIKLVLGLVNLVVFALIWLEPSGRCAERFAFWARFQIVPAVLALDVAVLAAQIALALLCGRVYCEVLCPLGGWQDLVRLATCRARGRTRRTCSRLPQTKAQRIVRWSVFVLFLVLGLAAFFPEVPACAGFGWLDPYGVFGRALLCFRAPPSGIGSLAVACGIFGFVTLGACVGHGRFWCNWICPIGSILGVLAHWAFVKNRPVKSCAACRKCFARGASGKEADAVPEGEGRA